MVTSRAVVGSSAMRSLGLQASAMAIITRWRMPPESWCGYCFATISGFGIFTSRRISTAFSAACFLSMPWWIMNTSESCLETVNTGFRLVMGSWKITEISFPRTLYISSMEILVRSRPSNSISPLAMKPLPSRRRRMLMAETLLPDPDSPTMPRVSPSRTA